MRWFIGFLGLIIVAAVGIYGAGSALPVSHTVIRAAYFKQPVQTVWDSIASYEKIPQWNKDITRVTKLPDHEGHAIWRAEDKNGGYMILEIEQSEAPRLHKSRIVETNLPFSGVWIFELKADAEHGGSYLKLTEKSEIPSPFFRFMTYYFFGIDMGIRRFLNSLGASFGETPAIQELVA